MGPGARAHLGCATGWAVSDPAPPARCPGASGSVCRLRVPKGGRWTSGTASRTRAPSGSRGPSLLAGRDECFAARTAGSPGAASGGPNARRLPRPAAPRGRSPRPAVPPRTPAPHAVPHPNQDRSPGKKKKKGRTCCYCCWEPGLMARGFAGRRARLAPWRFSGAGRSPAPPLVPVVGRLAAPAPGRPRVPAGRIPALAAAGGRRGGRRRGWLGEH